MKGRFFLVATAFIGMIAVTSCETKTGEVSKPIADAENLAENAAKKTTEAVDKVQQKADAIKKAQDESPSAQLPKTAMSFDNLEHDFGVIDEGDKVEHIFKFTNTGEEALVLEKCKGSCGCTVPECPKEPIAPGATGEIKVVFNSKGKKNKQTKKVTITANTEPLQTVLTIKAQVTPEPEG